MLKNNAKKNIFVPVIVFLLLLAFYFFKDREHSPTKITILNTTDLHAQFSGGEDDGGVLKLAKALKDEKRKVGGEQNCLLIDCGDLLQGSISSAETEGEIIVPIINFIDFDAIIPGNHDFDFGMNTFYENMEKLNADIIAANLSKRRKPVLPWKIYEKKGKKIALIGMTSPLAENWLYGDKYKGLKIKNFSDALDEVMPNVLIENPDLLILAVHHGLYNAERYKEKGNNLWSIAYDYPQIDLILGGHTHKKHPGKILGRDILYLQSGSYSESYGKIKVEFMEGKNKIEAEIINVKDTSPIKKQKLKKRLKDLDRDAERILIYNVDEILKENSVCKAIASAANTEIAISSLSINKLKEKDNIRYEDIFYLIPYEDTVIKIRFNAKELIKVIKEYRRKKENEAIVYGTTLKKLKSMPNKKELKVGFSSYDLAGAGNKLPFLSKLAEEKSREIKDTHVKLRNALINYFKQQKETGN